jgi:hypothetical protein
MNCSRPPISRILPPPTPITPSCKVCDLPCNDSHLSRHMNRRHQDITCSVINQAESIDNNYPDNAGLTVQCVSVLPAFTSILLAQRGSRYTNPKRTPLPSPDVSEPSSPANAPDSTTNYPPPSNNRAATAASTSSSSYLLNLVPLLSRNALLPPLQAHCLGVLLLNYPVHNSLPHPLLIVLSELEQYRQRHNVVGTLLLHLQQLFLYPPQSLSLLPRPTVSPHHRLLRLKILSSTLYHSLWVTLWHKST